MRTDQEDVWPGVISVNHPPLTVPFRKALEFNAEAQLNKIRRSAWPNHHLQEAIAVAGIFAKSPDVVMAALQPRLCRLVSANSP